MVSVGVCVFYETVKPLFISAAHITLSKAQSGAKYYDAYTSSILSTQITVAFQGFGKEMV